MLHLSTIRRHYERGFQSVVHLVELLESQIQELTLSNYLPLRFDHLQRNVSSQRNTIKHLSQTLENKSKELLKTHQVNHQAQVKLQLRLSKAQLLNKQLQAGIWEQEKALSLWSSFTDAGQSVQCSFAQKFIFVSENELEHKDWASRLAEFLLKIEEVIQQAHSESKTDLTDLQKSLFSNHYDRIMAEAEKAIHGSPKRKDLHLSAHNLYRRFSMNKKAILRFMTDFAVPFDNNGSERGLRMLKLQQKISVCFRTTESVQVLDICSTFKKPRKFFFQFHNSSL